MVFAWLSKVSMQSNSCLHKPTRYQMTLVRCPTLLHSLPDSSIVLALVFTVHPCCFRVCRRIWIGITKQWLPKRNSNFSESNHNMHCWPIIEQANQFKSLQGSILFSMGKKFPGYFQIQSGYVTWEMLSSEGPTQLYL